MTKLAHFIPFKVSYLVEDYDKLYLREWLGCMECPYSLSPITVPNSLLNFEMSFQRDLGTRIKIGTVFHTQIDGQPERTIQTLEDLLKACVIDFKGNWDDHLPLIKFAYNNSYHSSIGMTLFEALYDRRCRSLIGWFEIDEVALVGPKSVHKVMEKVHLIREML